MAMFEEIQLTPLRGRRNAQQYRKEHALVVEGREGYTELQPYAPLTRAEIVRRRYRRLYRVDLKPREVRVDVRLPSSHQARKFRADIRLIVKAANPMDVVEHRVEDPWVALEPVLLPPVRQLTRTHGLGDLSSVEQALHRYLTQGASAAVMELGLRITRASVSLDVDEDELKRERDKLQDEHFQELEMLRVQHQAKVDQLRDEQQHQLASLRAEHDRLLEAERERHRRQLHEVRQQLYKGIVGDKPQDLILAKLAARHGGLEPGDLDEVINLMAEQHWAQFARPLQLLAEHDGIIKDWQRDKLIEAVLNALAASFPQAPPTLTTEPVEASVDNEPTEAELFNPPDPEPVAPDPEAGPPGEGRDQ